MEAAVFYALAAVTLLSALLVVSLRRPIHNVVFMIITMIGIAGFFVLLRAEFIAMVQLIVYAGAVMVLFLFVIMLLNLDQMKTLSESSEKTWIGIMLSGVVFFLLVKVSVGMALPVTQGPGEIGTTENIAKQIFTTYLLPFEVASILLLAAIIGTVILARRRRDEENDRP
jgi:NADH-quinone oxidoreductase subunit J